MISVTKLNGQVMVINAELIEIVEKTPDTIISLITGKKYMVREPVEEIVAKVIEYRKQMPSFWRKVAEKVDGSDQTCSQCGDSINRTV